MQRNNNKENKNIGNLKFYEKYWLLLVFIIVGFFIVLTVVIGLKQSVWFDEAYSINLARRPVNELISLTAIDVHPPAYYLFLHIWGNCLGFGELSLRLSSAFLMATAILLISLLMKILFGKRLALISAIFVSLSPMLIRYGFEIRMYALATLISVLATFLLVKIEREKNISRRRLYQFSYAGLVTLGMLTLYYTIVIWMTHLGYLVYRTLKKKQSLFKQDFWLIYLLAVILFFPWFTIAIKQFTNGALAQISEPFTLVNLLGVFSFNLFYRPIWQLDQINGLLILLFIIIFSSLMTKNLKKRQEDRDEMIFLTFLATGPIFLEFLICLVKPMYVERYLVYSALFLIALIVYLFYSTEKGRRKLSFAFLTILILLGVYNLSQLGNFNFQRMQKPDIREVAENLKSSSLPILTDSPYEAIELGYYLGGNIHFYAPYETLKGGYAPLDRSKFKVTNHEELNQLGCFSYVYYSANIKSVFDENGFREVQLPNADSTKNTLKHTTFCKNKHK